MGQNDSKDNKEAPPTSVKDEEAISPNTTKGTSETPSVLKSITVSDSEEIFNEYQKYTKSKIKETEEMDKITTVTISKTVNIEPELEALDKLPRFTPLIKTAVEKYTKVYPGKELPKEHNLDGFDVTGLVAIGKEYQSFCKNWASEVMTQQKLVSAKVKRVETTCTRTSSQVSSHASDIKKFSAQFREVDRLQAQLDQINNSLINAIETTDKLYAILSNLPEFMENSEDGPLEPFIVYLKKKDKDILYTNQNDPAPPSAAVEKTPPTSNPSDIKVSDLRNGGTNGF